MGEMSGPGGGRRPGRRGDSDVLVVFVGEEWRVFKVRFMENNMDD